MREIITKEDVSSLISAMPEKETVWINDYRQRNEAYKTALKTGQCEELIKIIKTLYQEKKLKSALGKKLMKSDEDIFKAAEKQLNEEFATVLNISPDEVLPYILEHIS
jgi:CarD family transcriptional regulator